MKNTTIWHPDTCGCVISYEWDTDVLEENRVHVPVATEHTKVCPIHATHSNDVTSHHDAVLEENRRKNYSVGHLLENHMPQGSDHKDVKWRFDENRVLILTPLKTVHGAVQQSLDDKFGVGKVKLG